jgi:hypothetical protein
MSCDDFFAPDRGAAREVVFEPVFEEALRGMIFSFVSDS